MQIFQVILLACVPQNAAKGKLKHFSSWHTARDVKNSGTRRLRRIE